jgi:YVTN family beta-propeller protein
MRKNMRFSLCTFLLLLNIQFATTTQAAVDIYQYTHEGMFSSNTAKALFRVYVPNSRSGTVSVIDPVSYKVIQTFNTGSEPQHVVPAYDLKTLWVLNNRSNTVTPIDPATGKWGKAVSVEDPYNLYYTMDGKYAIVVCEAREQLQFRDPVTMKLLGVLPTQCKGANHMDFTPDGKIAIVTCEYGGELMKVDIQNEKVVGYLSLRAKHPNIAQKTTTDEFSITALGDILLPDPPMPRDASSMPQDVRSSADGKIFFVADMMKDGVILIDPIAFKQIGFIPTGIGTHAVYPSRDGKLFYISNRGCHHTGCPPHGPGSISVLDPAKKAIIANWSIPNGGSPDMGNISANGKELWLTGRYDSEVYVFDTTTGKLSHRIPVGSEPHGLAYWPQPGRFSLGHTGNMR